MFRSLITAMLFGALAFGASPSLALAQPAETPAEETEAANDGVEGAAPTADDSSAEAGPTGASADGAEVNNPAQDPPAMEVQRRLNAEETTGDQEPPGQKGADDKVVGGTASAGTKEDGGDEGAPYPFTDLQNDTYWLPKKAAGGINEHVDWMFNAILGLSVFCFVAITIAIVYLTWRYRHRKGHRTEPSRHHDNVLEITWTVIPSIICVLIFIGGWKGFLNMTTAPGDALDINVSGKKWSWSFSYQYAPGEDPVQRGELHVPVGRAVKLIMRSEDVLHSFYVPAFRTKRDVIPSRYSYLWFEADKPGVYRMYCAEYCGDSHWDMKTKVVVHEPGGYEAWLAAEWEADQIDCKDVPKAEQEECYMSQGEKLYNSKGCKQCHSLDGSSGTGPTFKGMWGQTRRFTDGSSATVDENYVRESIFEPMAKVRSGYSPVMPTFKGKLKDKDIDALNFWMKSL